MYIAVSDLMLLCTFKLHWSIYITFIYIGKLKKLYRLTLLQGFLYCRYRTKPTESIMCAILKR